MEHNFQLFCPLPARGNGPQSGFPGVFGHTGTPRPCGFTDFFMTRSDRCLLEGKLPYNTNCSYSLFPRPFRLGNFVGQGPKSLGINVGEGSCAGLGLFAIYKIRPAATLEYR